MFSKKDTNVTEQIKNLSHEYELRIKEIEANNKLALREKEFELRHFKDEEMKKLSSDITTKSEQIAVLKKENEMLQKITDLNADIIDIKDLVASLIKKLPEINLQNLTINGNK